MFGYVVVCCVLVIGVEEQVDDFVDNLCIVLFVMGCDMVVVNVQIMFVMFGVFEQYDEMVDVMFVVVYFGIWVLSIVVEVCDDVLLIFFDGLEGIKSVYMLFKKIVVL